MKCGKIKQHWQSNQTVYFHFCFAFATRTMGHHVAHCSRNKYKVKKEKGFEILMTWPSVLIVLLSGRLWRCKERIPAANLVVYRGVVRLTFPVSLGKIPIIKLIYFLIGQHESSIFIFIILHGRKTTFFVESSGNDIRKLVSVECCFRKLITKRTTKYEPES